MPALRNPYRERLQLVATAVAELETGSASASVGTTSYAASDLPALRRELDLLSVKAAIFAIEGGAQGYSLGGRAFTKADLKELYARRDQLEKREAAEVRGGMQVRRVVPLG